MAVFESMLNRSDKAKAAGIVAMPRVGFDVVPTDFMAAMLQARMPNVIFSSSPSGGTVA